MILMSILFAVGWAISNSFLGIKKIRNFELAISLANQAMEAARSARFRELGAQKDGRKDTLLHDFSSSNGVFDGEKCEGFVPVVTISGIEFKREVTIVNVPSKLEGLPSGLKLIRVLVSWRAPEDGTPLTFETASTVAEE